MLKTQ